MYSINVYKIWWEGKEDLYVGSTKRGLAARMTRHRGTCRSGKQYKLYEVMRVNGYCFRYVLLESYEINNRDQQLKYEQKWIDKLQPNLNMYRAFNTAEDTKRVSQQWHENHKNEIRIAGIKRRENNKDKIRAKSTIYRKKNIDDINRKRREIGRVNCECGLIVSKYNLPPHRKTKTHKKKMNLFFLSLLPFQ